MKIDIQNVNTPINEVRIGNVYPIAGGWGRKNGHLMVLLAITDQRTCLFVVVNKEGEPVDVTKYLYSVIEERCPIAYVDGIDTATLMMRGL